MPTDIRTGEPEMIATNLGEKMARRAFQECVDCRDPTGRTTEDGFQFGESGPLCEDCFDKRTTLLEAVGPQLLDAFEDVLRFFAAARSDRNMLILKKARGRD